jgi:FtsH-binding integral membrane protein
MTSVWLLYGVALLHFAIGSWAFLHIPKSDPRLDRNLEEIALMLFQVIGGVSLALSFWPAQNVRRSLRWSPVFIVGFALLTWIAAWALSPWEFFKAVAK